VSPHTSNSKLQLNFLLFGKALDLVEEKGKLLGPEPVIEFFPSARFKSVINALPTPAYRANRKLDHRLEGQTHEKTYSLHDDNQIRSRSSA
jgi:hypothetical protein